MDSEPDEHRGFVEPKTIVNDEFTDPFSSSKQDQPLNDVAEEFYSNFKFETSQTNPHTMNNIIENHEQEYSFDEFSPKKNSLDSIIQNLTKFHSILIEQTDKTQRITTQFQNQLISVKNLEKNFARFTHVCRSLIVFLLNLNQNFDYLTSNELEMLTLYSPNSETITQEIAEALLAHSFESQNENLIETYQQRLEYARIIMNLLKQINQSRSQIAALNDLLTKSVLPKNERLDEIEYSLRLPTTPMFSSDEQIDSLYDRFLYEINQQKVYVRCRKGQLKQNDIEILLIENVKHILAQINYNSSQKYSFIYDFAFKRVITSIDQLTIALPCFSLSTDNSTDSQMKQISIRCKRMMDPLIHIPALIETYGDISYAVFRLTHTLSSISVEAVFDYPFEILQQTNHDQSTIYTNDSIPIFRLETPHNYFLRSPRIRIIPLNSELIRCMNVLQRDEQLIACSDLIEFDSYKENAIEGNLSLTIQLTRSFNFNHQSNEDLQKRQRKAQKKLLSQRERFEQEKYDEAGGSLAATPTTSNYPLTSPTVMSHLPSIAAILGQRESRTKFHLNHQSQSMKTLMKWNFERFDNAHAPIILLGYKNRKWKNCNNFSRIVPSNEKDTYVVHLTNLFDRLILIRCWSETANDGKFDRFAENLCLLTSMKIFSCVLARDPSSIQTLARYALVIVPIQKQNFAEELLRKRNFTELIYNEQIPTETETNQINSYQSQHAFKNRSSFEQTNRYVQFCLSEGTYMRIVPKGNIDIHEKVDLNFRLYAQHPYVIEFDIYPIDVYRQKTDEDFIGSLNIYPINTQTNAIGSTSSSLTAAAISSRTSSGSKDLDLSDGFIGNTSGRTSISGPESLHNTSAAIGRFTTRDFNEIDLICSIRIRLPKSICNLPSIQSNRISMTVPDYFTNVMESLTEGKHEFAQALHIHPALMNSLLSQSHENSKTTLTKDETLISQENETLLKWFKRQNAFQLKEIIDKITSALIHIGRVDLAYIFKIDYFKNQCENLA